MMTSSVGDGHRAWRSTIAFEVLHSRGRGMLMPVGGWPHRAERRLLRAALLRPVQRRVAVARCGSAKSRPLAGEDCATRRQRFEA
jgi:hypothetical protein